MKKKQKDRYLEDVDGMHIEDLMEEKEDKMDEYMEHQKKMRMVAKRLRKVRRK